MPHRVTKERGTIPAWLREDDVIYYDIMPGLHTLHSPQFRDAGTFCINDTHWAVRPLKAGLTPWAGGDTAPTDYDGGRVMFRNGDMYEARGLHWDHAQSVSDIIGYPKRATAPQQPPVAPPSLADQLHRVMHPDASPWQSSEAHERGARFIMQRERAAYDHAVRLLNALDIKHAAIDGSRIKPADTISGVIDQIDNLTTAWNAPDPDSAQVRRLTKAEALEWARDNRSHRYDIDGALHMLRTLDLIKPDPKPTILEQFTKETGVAITNENRADIEKALSWHRSTGNDDQA